MKCNWSCFIGCIAALSFLTFLPFMGHADFPADPISNIAWEFSDETTVLDIESRFNNARAEENDQLGSSLPMLTMPSQADWDIKSDTEKALWLINEERRARGIDILPLHSGEPHTISVAQNYAQFLLDNDVFDHFADGKGPWVRLGENPAIGACRDFLGVAENLAVFYAWGVNWTLPVERSVHGWMYDDAGSSWGHRHAILWYPYNDNSGAPEKEGFLGIGTSYGSFNHENGTTYPNSIIVVMNVFDPCSSWDYSTLIVPGDVNGNMILELADAISVLKIVTGNPPPAVHLNADINDDEQIGIAEAMYILDKVAGN